MKTLEICSSGLKYLIFFNSIFSFPPLRIRQTLQTCVEGARGCPRVDQGCPRQASRMTKVPKAGDP